MSDEVKHAYAILGLPPTATPEQLKRRYRLLVRKWHPDRFASDPVGQAEATDRMARVNQAYRLLSASRPRGSQPHVSAPTPASASRPGSRLTREEIDGMVQAIGTAGPIDQFLGWFEWIWWAPTDPYSRERLSPVGAAVYVAALVILLLIDFRLDWAKTHPFLIWLALAAVVWWRLRTRPGR